MSEDVTIRMMGEFSISVNGKEVTNLASRTKKGVSLMTYLVLNAGKQVPRQRLKNMLWSDYLHANPDGAMKTLISRLRKTLDESREGLGECIGSQRGSYYWQDVPGVKVDLLEIMNIFEDLPREKDPVRRESLFRSLLHLYTGDLYLTGDIEGGEGYQAALHTEYLNAVYEYIEFLMEKEQVSKILDVCKKARKIDQFDERLYIEMMQAQVGANRLADAMEEYRKLTDLTRKHLDAEPSEEMQKFYQKVIQSGSSLKFNLESIRTELQKGKEGEGAYQCGFEEFKQIFNLLNPTMNRLGCSMFLAMILLSDQDSAEPSETENIRIRKLMDSLFVILHDNLRRGDIMTRYSSTMAIVMLPTVNYTTGNMIMERIRHLFFEENPDAGVPFHYRIDELK